MQRLTLVISFWSIKMYVDYPKCKCSTDHTVCDLFFYAQAFWSNLSLVLFFKKKGSESRKILLLFLLFSFITAIKIFSITVTKSIFLRYFFLISEIVWKVNILSLVFFSRMFYFLRWAIFTVDFRISIFISMFLNFCSSIIWIVTIVVIFICLFCTSLVLKFLFRY